MSVRAAAPRRGAILPGASIGLMLFGCAVTLAAVVSPHPNNLQYLNLGILSAPSCIAAGITLLMMRRRYGARRRWAVIPFGAAFVFLVGPIIRISTSMDLIFAATALAAAVFHVRVTRALPHGEGR